MSGLMTLKEIGKVGNKALVRAAGLVESVKRKVVTEVIEYDKCPASCNVQKLIGTDEAKKRAYCLKFCPFNQKKEVEKTVYEYERHRYKIRLEEQCETERLSRSQLLLYITYHMMPIAVDGIVKHATVKELANQIGVNKRTIKRANEKLEKLKIISVMGSQNSVFKVLIPDYKEYHASREKGGTGYVQMTKEFLESLYKIQEVNSIRLALRLLLLFEREVVVRNELACVVTYEEIKRFLPKNMNHKKIIDASLKAIETLFDIVKSDKYITVHLKDSYNGKVQKEKKEKQFMEEIEQFVSENELYVPVRNEEAQEKPQPQEKKRKNPDGDAFITPDEFFAKYEEKCAQNEVTMKPILKKEDIQDLSSSLAMEYGIELVKAGLKRAYDLVKSNQSNTPDEIFNFGGFIRVGIESVRNKQYLAKTTM